jgi:hypothetical protein
MSNFLQLFESSKIQANLYSYNGRIQVVIYCLFMGRYKWSVQETALLKLLKEIRQEAGLSGPAIQKALNRPNSYVAKVESGDKRLDILELNEYCQVCGISLEKFSARLAKILPEKI